MDHETAGKARLNVLCLEDSPEDIEIIRELLIGAGYELSMDCTEKEAEFTSLLRGHTHDVILSDFTLPGFDAFGALALSHTLRPDVPFICVSGSIGEETAIELIRHGAADYVMKDHLVRLPLVIKRALDDAKGKEIREQVEETLRKSEERYRALFTFSPDALCVLVDGRITLANPAFSRLLGAKDPSQLIGKSAFEIVHPDYHAKVRERFDLVLGGHPTPLLEERFIRLDGTVVTVEVSSVAIDWQGSRGVQVIARDITGRKQAEEALREHEHKYRNIFENIQDVYYEASIDGTILELSPSIENMSKGQYHRDDLIGKSMYDFYGAGERPALLSALKERGSVAEFEVTLRNRDGSLIPCSLSSTIQFNAQGIPQTIIGSLRNITERKRAEEVVRDSEERFRMVFENVFDGISIYSENSDPSKRRLVECNSRYAAMAGRSRDELMKLGSTQGLQITLEDTANSRRLESLNIGTAYQGSFSWIRPDGKDNIIEYVGMPITWRGESYSIGIDRDVTDRRKAEREVRLMAQTLASVRDCITITDLEDRFLFVNDAFRSTYGYTSEELLGKNISILRSPRSPGAIGDQIIHDTSGGGWHGEILNRRKDGSDFPVELWTSVVKDEAGTPVALVGVARNITDRKAAEEHLRQSEEQFRLIAENVADMIAVLDLDGRRIYNSPSYRSILGDPEALKATDGFQEIHPEDRERVKQVFQETARTGIGQRLEYRFLLADGSVRTIDSKGSVIRDSDGKISRIIVVSRDVTEEKMLATQFLRSQRMESIGTLAGGIAHDLNNVLAPIMMAIEVLRGKISDQGGQRILNTIETSARRGADIVRQVLAFGRGVKGERILVQLKHVVNEVAKIAGETFPKSIEIKTDIPRDLWTVLADPTQMHQVLLNMLVNARDAMPKGGTLTVSAGNIELDDSYSRMHLDAKPGPYVSLAITDTGTGIPAAIREKIFEPFFTTKEIGMGTGLGLSTTLAIVRSHGGFINLDSDVGKGTTFRIYIPATGRGSPAPAAIAEAELPTGNGELVLIVDDEAAIREITKETLQAYGYKAMTASDGAEGVAIFAENKENIKVVITDIMMPVMDGTAAILVLRKINPDVKIIAASGLTAREQIKTPSESDVQAFLTKPYTAEKLLKALAAVLR